MSQIRSICYKEVSDSSSLPMSHTLSIYEYIVQLLVMCALRCYFNSQPATKKCMHAFSILCVFDILTGT